MLLLLTCCAMEKCFNSIENHFSTLKRQIMEIYSFLEQFHEINLKFHSIGIQIDFMFQVPRMKHND